LLLARNQIDFESKVQSLRAEHYRMDAETEEALSRKFVDWGERILECKMNTLKRTTLDAILPPHSCGSGIGNSEICNSPVPSPSSSSLATSPSTPNLVTTPSLTPRLGRDLALSPEFVEQHAQRALESLSPSPVSTPDLVSPEMHASTHPHPRILLDHVSSSIPSSQSLSAGLPIDESNNIGNVLATICEMQRSTYMDVDEPAATATMTDDDNNNNSAEVAETASELDSLVSECMVSMNENSNL